jgi:bifunctional DNase/RNase
VVDDAVVVVATANACSVQHHAHETIDIARTQRTQRHVGKGWTTLIKKAQEIEAIGVGRRRRRLHHHRLLITIASNKEKVVNRLIIHNRTQQAARVFIAPLFFFKCVNE